MLHEKLGFTKLGSTILVISGMGMLAIPSSWWFYTVEPWFMKALQNTFPIIVKYIPSSVIMTYFSTIVFRAIPFDLLETETPIKQAIF